MDSESQKYDNFYIHDLQISNNKSVHLGIKQPVQNGVVTGKLLFVQSIFYDTVFLLTVVQWTTETGRGLLELTL